MSGSIQIAVDMLSALLTGGFLLFFIETMHIENDVKQRFISIMNPFYHSLSKMAVFVGYMSTSLTYPKSQWGERLKMNMDFIRKVAIVPLSSGRDIPFMKSEELDKVCESINDIWYCLDRSPNLRGSLTIHDGMGLDSAASALVEIYENYKGKPVTIDLLHDASGNFYVDFWQPIEHCTSNYEYWQGKARLSRILIFCAFGFSLISLIIIMVLAEIICPIVPCTLAILSAILSSVCIGVMTRLVSLSNRLFRTV